MRLLNAASNAAAVHFSSMEIMKYSRKVYSLFSFFFFNRSSSIMFLHRYCYVFRWSRMLCSIPVFQFLCCRIMNSAQYLPRRLSWKKLTQHIICVLCWGKELVNYIHCYASTLSKYALVLSPWLIQRRLLALLFSVLPSMWSTVVLCSGSLFSQKACATRRLTSQYLATPF